MHFASIHVTVSSTRPITETLKRYGRATAGGLLFAVASIYTMEFWWQGFTTPTHVLLVTFIATLAILTAYAHYAGFHNEKSIGANVAEALEALTIGFAITLLMLKLIGQLPPGISFSEALGRVVMTGVSVAIGVAIGTTQLGQDPDEKEGGGQGKEKKEQGSLGHDFTFSILGAILIGFSVSSTEEIVMIAVQSPTWAALALAVLTFGISLGIVSYVGFKGSGDSTIFAGGSFGDACVTYGAALLVSAALLWSAGRFEGVGFASSLHYIVYLALPCALGSAAGRLLL